MGTNRRQALRLGALQLALLAALLPGCGGRSLRSGVSVGPRLTSARLGALRGAMTYDGDWLGGTPPMDSLPADLDLAARRGVEVVVDLRSPKVREAVPLQGPAGEVGLDVVEVDLMGDAASSGPTAGPSPERVPITDRAVDRVRAILESPGRRRTLLLDDDGTYASTLYAIHLIVDENVPAAEALRAARATGLDAACEAFVADQVVRIRGGAGR